MNLRFWEKKKVSEKKPWDAEAHEKEWREQDDGWKFQWGEHYFKHHEWIPKIGGKYVRWNPDGSTTEFMPEGQRIEVAIMSIPTLSYKKTIIDGPLEKYALLEFESEETAKGWEKEINEDHFFSIDRGVIARADGKILKVGCTPGVMTSTQN